MTKLFLWSFRGRNSEFPQRIVTNLNAYSQDGLELHDTKRELSGIFNGHTSSPCFVYGIPTKPGVFSKLAIVIADFSFKPSFGSESLIDESC
ncbi:MAG: hypothetical protein AAFW75_17310 [Cyanobacteria bacterium J06636_16]